MRYPFSLFHAAAVGAAGRWGVALEAAALVAMIENGCVKKGASAQQCLLEFANTSVPGARLAQDTCFHKSKLGKAKMQSASVASSSGRLSWSSWSWFSHTK